MAASGFTPISLYYSTTASAVPLAANLANGELALNTADMKLYSKNSAGVVTLLAASTGATGTVSSVALSGGTTGLTVSGSPITTSGTITLAGTLAIANGGTGQTTANAAFNALVPSQTSQAGKYLTTDGTNTSWGTNPLGTVTSVGQSFTGGLISVAGSPVTTSGTLALTVAGTSGGIPYFSSASTWATSAALAASSLVVGGGAGAAPATVTTGTGVVTALGVAVGTAGSFVVNGGVLGTPSSGTLTNCTFPTLNQNTTGNAATATTATNLAGGSAGTIPYQSAAGTTVQLTAGTAGYILQANGAAAPSWVVASTAAGVNNGTLTLNVSGTGLSGSQTFTANQSTAATFTVTSNATNVNTVSTIVARDASGNFGASTIGVTALAAVGVGGTNDPYGTVSVSQAANASNYSYYGLTRVANIGAGFGLTGTTGALGLGANAFWFGTGTSGHSGTMSDAYIAFNASDFKARASITATTQFNGAGTGLTGTATSLSIGGNAATATTATSATSATTATNIAGGAAGRIPYNTGSGATSFVAVGTSGQVLQSNGTSAPTWTTVSSGSQAFVAFGSTGGQ